MTRAIRGAIPAIALALVTSTAHAGGLYFSEIGGRPLSRGGAFVAGAEDIHAAWYNPAGLADGEASAMADFTMYLYSGKYTRAANVTDGSGAIHTVHYPTSEAKAAPLPIPFIGGQYAFGEEKELTAALAVYAPNTPILTWPETVDGQPAGQRYSMISIDGSLLAILSASLAWKPIKEIQVGASFQTMVGSFQATTVFNVNPNDRLLGAPEDPSYDALTRLSLPIFAPSGNFGVIAKPDERVRVGVAVQLPFLVRSKGRVQMRLPSAAVFDRAAQVGDSAEVDFNLPWIFRAGVEIRPEERFRIEAAYVREFWATHHSFEVEPDNISLVNITGFVSPYKVGHITFPKNYEDTHSFRLGGEGKFKLHDSEDAISARVGLMYEPSAVPADYVSAITLDFDKVTVGLGGSYHLGASWRFDATLAHAFTSELSVDPATAKVPRVNPVKGNPTQVDSINGGTYSVNASIIGLGARYQF